MPTDNLEHVGVLVMENRPFDNLWLVPQAGILEARGLCRNAVSWPRVEVLIPATDNCGADLNLRMIF